MIWSVTIDNKDLRLSGQPQHFADVDQSTTINHNQSLQLCTKKVSVRPHAETKRHCSRNQKRGSASRREIIWIIVLQISAKINPHKGHGHHGLTTDLCHESSLVWCCKQTQNCPRTHVPNVGFVCTRRPNALYRPAPFQKIHFLIQLPFCADSK